MIYLEAPFPQPSPARRGLPSDGRLLNLPHPNERVAVLVWKNAHKHHFTTQNSPLISPCL